MAISVREFFSRGGLFEFSALIFTSKQTKAKICIDEIDELVGLNILLANFIENLLLLQDKQQHENSDE